MAAKGERIPSNPFRGLLGGYSTYTRDEAVSLRKETETIAARSPAGFTAAKPKKAKRDQIRERRFAPGEQERIEMALRGERLPGATWVRPPNPDLEMLFELIVDSGMRLQEAYTLRVKYLQLDKGFTKVDGTKGRAGVEKPRIVPLKPALLEKPRFYAERKTELLFLAGSDVEICKIMGWWNYAMVLRYASLRGEDLAARMAL